MKLVVKMHKVIHTQESKTAAREKAKQVATNLRAMKLPEAAKKVEDSIVETLTYMEFPYEHWLRIQTNNVFERLNREIRRRTGVIGTFLDGNPTLMLVCAHLTVCCRHPEISEHETSERYGWQRVSRPLTQGLLASDNLRKNLDSTPSQ